MIAYHVAPKTARESIFRTGLNPRKSQTGSREVWFFTDPTLAYASPRFDIWRANLTGITTTPGHLASSEWSSSDSVVVTCKRVRPNRLTLCA